ncbi:MAG: hypothetical protein LAP87_22855 [Acidobacteriia bacterium]|nr:hypothetical protein [Terriglobia bacterium]
MKHRPGATVPVSGIYWCSVCKLPERFTAGQQFPECRNMCGRGLWELVEEQGGEEAPR